MKPPRVSDPGAPGAFNERAERVKYHCDARGEEAIFPKLAEIMLFIPTSWSWAL